MINLKTHKNELVRKVIDVEFFDKKTYQKNHWKFPDYLRNCIVNRDAKIGSNTIINNKALIEHDVTIGDNCHISTGALVNGGVEIGNNCFVGSGSVIKQGIIIKDDSFIQANSFIGTDIT